MFYILFFIAGFALAIYYKSKPAGTFTVEKTVNYAKEHIANKDAEALDREAKILNLLREKGQATNDDIQELLDVADSTATRYLDHLEKAGKITQIGDTGRGVHYKLKQEEPAPQNQ